MSKRISADQVYNATDAQMAALPSRSVSRRMLGRAQIMADKTNSTPTYAGATANLHTLEPLPEKAPGIVVGGLPDVRSGKQFPSLHVERGSSTDRPNVNRGDVLHARREMRPAAGNNPEASIGTWLEGPSTYSHGVALDLGTVHQDRTPALRAIVGRNEDAGWDNGVQQPISFNQAQKELGIASSQQMKKVGQTAVMRQRGSAVRGTL